MSEHADSHFANEVSKIRASTPTELVVAGALMLLGGGLALSDSSSGSDPWPFAIGLVLVGLGAAALMAASVALGIRLAREK